MRTHISRTAASCFGILRQLRSVHKSLPRHPVVSLVTSLVLTNLDYCNSLLVGVADCPSGPKTKKYCQDNIEKTSWELANVRLVTCLKTLIEIIITIIYIHKNYIQRNKKNQYTKKSL